MAHDFGVSAPSVTYVVAKSDGGTGPDGRFYPRGSIVLLDELATHEPVCEYWWATVPSLPRDPRRSDDVDSRAADHAADACRYAIVGQMRLPVAASGRYYIAK